MLIDIGVNLTNPKFAQDLPEVIARAKQAGVVKQLVTGTCEQSSQAAIALCQQYPEHLACTVGVHPHDADNVSDSYLKTLIQLAQSPFVKAIGECGLDFNRNFSTPDNQKIVFEQQLFVAAQLQLPVFLHQRDAFKPWFEILTPYIPQLPAMVSHCFTGNKTELTICLEQGFYIGITGWLCDKKRGQALRDIVKYIPLDRLMIETDAPYLTPQNIRPKPKSSRNEPSYLPYVATMLSECTGHSVDKIIEASYQNAAKVFNLHD